MSAPAVNPAELRVLDLFAGPGGWDEGARELGIDALGIEFDDAACATREAAGHRTVQADIAKLDPLEFGPVDLLIASPPCQAWSLAGKRGGVEDIERVYELTAAIAARQPSDLFGEDAWTDPRSELVTEPLRWALALEPRFLAFEQVPPVLDYWRHVGELLRREGYGVWTGILECERYGVPQTRERAILMAELDGNPHPPQPTHQRYVPGEPARHEITLEGEILPWVSMAQALGWGMTERPTFTVAAGTEAGGADSAMVGGSGARAALEGERERGAWKIGPDTPRRGDADRSLEQPAPTIKSGGDAARMSFRPDEMKTHEDRRREVVEDRDTAREVDEPAATVTTKLRSAEWRMRNGGQPNQAERGVDEPAPTIIGGHDTANRVWIEGDDPDDDDAGAPRGTHLTKDDCNREGAGNVPRPVDEPAPAVTTRLDLAEWTGEQPAPTIVGTRRSDEGMVVGRQLPPGEGRNVGGHGYDAGELEQPNGDGPGYLDTRQSHAKARPTDEPAPAMVGQNLAKGAAVFTDEPATETTEGTGYKPTKGVRVTEREASVLQGFRADYPWQGSRTKQFQQIGNAVPPPLATAVLRALIEGAQQPVA